MSEQTPVADAGPLPFSRLLADVAAAHGGDRLRLSALAKQLRDRAWGGLLIVFAAINLLPLPPGATTITGIPLLFVAGQLAAGRARPWFPKRLDERGISTATLGVIAARMAPLEKRIERLLRPRLCALTNHRGARAIGVVCLILSIILWLPIPLGNHAPALAISLFALALIYRDGVLVILGAVAAVASALLLSLTYAAAWWGLVHLWHSIA